MQSIHWTDSRDWAGVLTVPSLFRNFFFFQQKEREVYDYQRNSCSGRTSIRTFSQENGEESGMCYSRLSLLRVREE